MAKVLPILGIVGAVFGALAIAVLVDAAVFLVVAVAVAGSIVLLGQRTIVGAVGGLLVLALAVLAALGLAGSVTTEDGSTAFGLSEGAGRVLAVACCLAVTLAAVAARWDVAFPRWMALGGAACAVLAILIAAVDPEALAQQNEPMTLVAAVLALLSIGAMVSLMKADGIADASRPPTSAPVAASRSVRETGADAPVRQAAAPRPPASRRP